LVKISVFLALKLVQNKYISTKLIMYKVSNLGAYTPNSTKRSHECSVFDSQVKQKLVLIDSQDSYELYHNVMTN
jgi:hypothetical protein